MVKLVSTVLITTTENTALNNLEGFQPKGKRKWVGGKKEEVEFGNVCFKENENLKPKERRWQGCPYP